MFLKITDAFKGLKHLPKIYKSLYEDTIIQYKLIKLNLDNFKHNLKLSKYLGCKISTICSYYKHMGYFHLEVSAHNGNFIYKSHRIDDIYPNITVIDTNKDSFDALDLLLEKAMCKVTLIDLDINKEPIDLTVKFNSVALPFVLERLEGGLTAIDSFLSNLKTQLNIHNSVVFGVTVPAVGLNNNSKSNLKNYIGMLENQKVHFNKNLSVEQLSEVFNKHFKNVSLHFEGSCLFFILEPELQKLKLKPILPKSDPLEMPFV